MIGEEGRRPIDHGDKDARSLEGHCHFEEVPEHEYGPARHRVELRLLLTLRERAIEKVRIKTHTNIVGRGGEKVGARKWV